MFSKSKIEFSYEFFSEHRLVNHFLNSNNWGLTSIGIISTWPHSLKSTIRLMLDSATPMYLLWGEERIQFFNGPCFDIFGEEVSGHCLGQSVDQNCLELWQYIAPFYSQVLEGRSKNFTKLVLPLENSSGKKECSISLSVGPVRNDEGKIVGLLALLNENIKQDLEEKKLRDEVNKLRTITNNIPSFVSYVDNEGKYNFVNRTYSEWTGTASSPIGISSKDVKGLGHTSFEFIEPYHKRAMAGERARFELFFSRPDGEFVILDAEYLPDIDPITNKVRGLICVGQNITERRKALLETEKAQKELRDIFMQTPLPMAIMSGPELIFTLANPSYIKFAGRDVLNKPLLEIFTEKEVEKFLPSIRKVFSEGRPVLLHETSLKFINKKGQEKEIILDAEYHPFKNSIGTTVGVMIVLHDVTEKVMARRKVEESEERYRNLADTIPQLIWTAKPNGRIDYANQRCTQYCGLNSQSKIANWLRVVHPDDLPVVFNSWKKSMQTGTLFMEEYRIKSTDGVFRWFLGRSVPVKNQNNEVLYWNGTATDIEKHKKIEQELENARALAEKASKTKSAFLANMSHEIRTPLSAILGYSEMLKNGALNSDLREHYFETINRNGKSLGKIIDGILDLAKVEAGKIELEQINFCFEDLLKEVVELMTQKAQSKNISLGLKIENGVSRFLISDPARLRQIFLNIIGNAVKFTERGSVNINVRAKNLFGNTSEIFVEVEDTGPGLDEEQRKKLFRPFFQAEHSLSQNYGGTGLGLALSKSLAEALGGTITVGPYRKDAGCTFVISFRALLGEEIKTNVHDNHGLTSKENPPLHGLKILFVDDSEDNQFLVEHFLSINGASVSLASDGREAVDKAMNGDFHVVLMDIQMPRMDGYQATQLLISQGYKVPIVALTAHAMESEREKTRTYGFCSHLTKPFNFNELLQTVAQYGSRSL